MGVDKVFLISKGVFLVRFTTMENRDKVIATPKPFFENKPVFLKAWEPEMEIHKEELKMIPIWIQLWGLELKYWGEKSLSKILGKLGNFMKVDQATINWEKLQYLRVMVEVNISQTFPDTIQFINEKGFLTAADFKYEWKPEKC